MARRLSISVVLRKSLFGAAASLALTGCASRPATLPALEEYTRGASPIAEEAARLFESAASSSRFRRPESGELLDAAERWRTEAEDARVESWVVDFPRKPAQQAVMKVRVSLEGSRRGQPGERLSADELFDIDLSRERSQWRVAGARAAGPPEIRSGRPHLREVASEIGLSAARNDSLDPVEATNISHSGDSPPPRCRARRLRRGRIARHRSPGP